MNHKTMGDGKIIRVGDLVTSGALWTVSQALCPLMENPQRDRTRAVWSALVRCRQVDL